MRCVDGDNSIPVQRDHHAETSGGDQVDCGNAETRRQNAIEWGRRTAALNVAEHADANVFAGAAGDGIP